MATIEEIMAKKKQFSRRFYALLVNESNGDIEAARLAGKCSKKYATSRTRKFLGKGWKACLVAMNLERCCGSFNPADYKELKTRVEQGNFLSFQ